MTTSHDDPTHPFATFLAAFNAGDATALDRAYEPGALLVPRPGLPLTGAERTAANTHLLRTGLPMRADLRHTYVTGDIALLIVDWSIQGTTGDGTALNLTGTATDVTRRGPDGVWRYAIDNPAGIS